MSDNPMHEAAEIDNARYEDELEDCEGNITLRNPVRDAVDEDIFLIRLRHSFEVQEWERARLVAETINAVLFTAFAAAMGYGLWVFLR